MPTRPLTDVLHCLRRTAGAAESAPVPDAELLERFLHQRDEAAFELLVWRHGRMVHAVCRRVLRNGHDADDAFQATFLALARQAASIRQRATVGGWLRRVAYRIALDARARAVRRTARQQPLDETYATGGDPAAEAARHELLRAIDSEISRLPEKYRVPFVRCCCEGESTVALARELGCPVGTVESWLTRARKRLRTRLLQRGLSAGFLPAAAPGISARLVATTVKAATGGPVPAEVAALTQGVLNAMRILRIKIVAVVVALVVACFGAGLLARDTTAVDGKQPSESAAATPAPADRVQRGKRSGPGRIFAEVVFPWGLAARLAGSNPSQLVSIDPDTGKWTRVSTTGGIPRVSPDGRSVAFLRQEELWRCDTQGREQPVRLAAKAGRPCWSPDGKYLVYSPGEIIADGGWKNETWRMHADGTGATRLKIPATDAVEDWSPDGRWFVTCSDRHPPRGSGYQLYRMHPDGTAEQRLTQGRGLNCYARFSPDGRRLVYLHQERGVNSLHVMNADGTGDHVVLPSKGLTRPDCACWSPDGKRLAVVCVTRPRPGAKDLFGRSLPETFQFEVVDADGSHRRPLNLPDRSGDPIAFVGVGHADWR